MVKHTQAISHQRPKDYLSVFDLFVRLAPKGLTNLTNLNDYPKQGEC